jgi:murein DD-endopeptidase MepM/ murein hydrolase activator NlpD
MIRALTLTVAGVVALPVLLLSGAPGTGSGPVLASAGGSDLAHVAPAPAELRVVVLDAARAFALPPALLVAVAKVESNFDPTTVGPRVPGGPAQGLMQFLPESWARFNTLAGATPFDPGPAVLAATRHLLSSGALAGGGWDAAKALLGYNHSAAYVQTVLGQAAAYGYTYSPAGPPLDATRYTFPLQPAAGQVRPSYGSTHHDYPATDIFTPIGTPVVAVVRAQVLALSRTEVGKGGLSVTLRGEDGWRYYYAHLSSVRPELRIGQIVQAGQLLALSGNTGNARTTAPHLHLGISHTGSVAGQISPYPYLQLWQAS